MCPRLCGHSAGGARRQGPMVPLCRALSAAAQLALAPRGAGPGGGKLRPQAKVKRLSPAIFARLPTNLVDESALPAPWEKLRHLNRYPDIIPNPHSRVRLRRLGVDPLTEYVNANHVRGAEGSGRSYIASQGPTRNSVADFWRMVWEQGSTAIVMLTGVVENGHRKCERYWPSGTGPEAEVRAGDLVVAMESVLDLGTYSHSVLRIRHIDAEGCEGERHVHHFWYNTWPDHGTPEDTSGVLAMLHDVRLHSKGDPSEPWVVHCSAGIGRTGTFIAIDMGAFELTATGTTDVQALVRAMREDRGGMVQTPQQADFVYRALLALDGGMESSPDG